jgi:hypothetical protein
MARFKKSYLILLILPLLCFVTVFFYVYTNRPPVIYFPRGTVYDFGVLSENSKFTASFLFENHGGKPLEIKNIKTNCGCINATAEKQILRAGESSRINITYTATGDRKGRQEVVKALVESNDPDNPIVVLSLVGEVNRVVFWYPNAVSFYCEQGAIGKQQEIRFKTYKGETLTIKEMETSSNKVSVSCETRQEGAVCIIAVDPNCAKGNWEENVKLVASVEEVEKPVNIPVHLMIK